MSFDSLLLNAAQPPLKNLNIGRQTASAEDEPNILMWEKMKKEFLHNLWIGWVFIKSSPQFSHSPTSNSFQPVPIKNQDKGGNSAASGANFGLRGGRSDSKLTTSAVTFPTRKNIISVERGTPRRDKTQTRRRLSGRERRGKSDVRWKMKENKSARRRRLTQQIMN